MRKNFSSALHEALPGPPAQIEGPPRNSEVDSYDPIHLKWVKGSAAIRREQRITVASLILTLGAVAVVVCGSIAIALDKAINRLYISALADVLMIAFVALLAYGTLVYLLARGGHLKRLHESETASDPQLSSGRDDSALLILIPSYCEAPQVLWRAVVSAALQQYGQRRVVLLIDDPPQDPPTTSLSAVRALPGRVQEMLNPMRDRCEMALRKFEQRTKGSGLSSAAELRTLAEHCHRIADWFATQADNQHIADVADEFFVKLTLRIPASRWRHTANSWSRRAAVPGACISSDEVRQAYLHIVSVFRVEITTFARKKFVNLSHATNKAMNVNSYLSLLGGSYRREWTESGLQLSACNVAEAEMMIPDAEFVLILDADTMISPDYAPKLMRRFEASGGERLAVVQSPYSTFPSGRTMLQRIAGAQTDIQYLVHQGLTHYNATYWVGANALVRVAALRDIAVADAERGFKVIKFIRDRTLIEDTESSIDLVTKGWRLFNEPERLAFSMTPPDFGSLLIQRQRWANGGLIIVPKLLAYLRQPARLTDRLKEGVMRLHYLISLGPVSMALLVALGVSFHGEIRTACLGAIGGMYYLMYARDLHLIGYPFRYILRVVALNLLLIPINLIGLGHSIVQAITGRKAAFSRTPKVHDRTPVPLKYLLAEFALLTLCCVLAGFHLLAGAPVRGAIIFVHAIFMAYAIAAFIGWTNAAND